MNGAARPAAPAATGPAPAARLAGFAPYRPRPLDAQITLKLDANEGPRSTARGTPEPAGQGELLRRYPDAARLEAQIAERYGLAPQKVLVTAGVDDALFRACLAMLEPGRSVVLTDPTFEMLPKYAQLAGGGVTPVPWLRGAFPLDAARAAVRPDTALIVVVTPNNPTGLASRAADVAALAAAAPRALVVVDHAYVEFADEDLTGAALTLSNVVVMRTFSKAWGLAGLRVGYALGPAPLIAWLRAGGNPYAASALSVAIASDRLAHGAESVARAVARVRTEREQLADLLVPLAEEVWRGQANFVLARFAPERSPVAGLRARGIAVRDFEARPGLERCVRITCPGDAEEFARLAAALKEVLGG